MESLTGNRAFVDGNKRTVISSIGLFLIYNGYCLNADHRQLAALILACAEKLVSKEEMAARLKNHAT